MGMISPIRFLLTLLLAASAPLAFAADQHGHSDKTSPDTAWLAQARETYPLPTCVVSGEALGSMGETFEYIHRVDGEPDRLVRMCCEGCLRKFKKEPSKYLARLDAAKGTPQKKSARQPACCTQ